MNRIHTAVSRGALNSEIRWNISATIPSCGPAEDRQVSDSRFKRITRILKRLRDDMVESGTSEAALAAKPIASFLMECLVFNAPDGCFNREEGSYHEDTKAVIQYLHAATVDDKSCNDLVEVSRLKYLFRSTQAWSRASANEFLVRAWQHVGFKNQVDAGS